MKLRPDRWTLLCSLALLLVFAFNPKALRLNLKTMGILAGKGLEAQIDLHVYETAAYLVHAGGSAHLYDGAADGTDPQYKPAPELSAYAEAGRHLGFSSEGMFVYPPMLADILSPLMYLSPGHAAAIYDAVNILSMLIAVVLLIDVLELRWSSGAWVPVLAGVFLMYPVYAAVWLGQPTPLLLLVMVGVSCYRRQMLFLSAFAISLAAAIKITPLLLVLPFVFWKEWKWLRYCAVCLLGWLMMMTVVNGPHLLWLYATKVTPAMSQGFPNLGNKSLLSGLQVLYQLSRGGLHFQNSGGVLAGAPIPKLLVTFGKAMLLAIAALFLWLAGRLDERRGSGVRSGVLLAITALSVVVSPVSWIHAYVLVYPVLVVLWVWCFRRLAGGVVLAVTVLASLELTEGNLTVTFHHFQVPHLFFVLPWLTPLAGLAAAFALVLAREHDFVREKRAVR